MIKFSRVKKIHFVGIGGSGMSGIAEVLHNMGFTVSGSDIGDSETVKRLKAMGITVFLGHAKENIAGIETLVYSSAVTKENEEVKEALLQKIPVIPRAEMLAELMRVKYSIAVAGTHGKTSTTSMVATILTQAKKDPTYVVGGKLKIEESGAKLGKSDYIVVEADESDGSFLRLYPSIAIITNIENDHLDYYQNMDNLREAFKEFGNKVPFYGSIIVNTQCPEIRHIISGFNKRVITYSIGEDTDFRAEHIVNNVFGSSFELIIRNKNEGLVELNAGGRHNVSNALAAIAAATEIGIDMDTIKEGLKRFYLPERRFQVLFYNKDYLVVDDYAHHPTEIKATIDILRSGHFRQIFAVFQPHRYTRLGMLMDEFPRAFTEVDQLIIAPLYTANQTKIEHVDSSILAEKIKESGFKNVRYINSFDDIRAHLAQELQQGDAVVFLSAGNLTRTAHEFAKQMEEKVK